MKKLVLSCLGATLIGLLAPAAGQAAVTVYTSPSSYSAATTGNTTYSFPNAASGSANTYTDGPLTFSSSALAVFNDNAYGGGVVYLGAASPETISLSGASSLAFNLGTYSGADNIAISINGTMVATLMTSGRPATNFIGFTDNVPITSLALTTASGHEIDAINFQVGTAAVPEPSTWAMLGAGAIGAGFVALRRRRAAA